MLVVLSVLLSALFNGCEAAACTDDNNMCAYWSSMGECEKNPGYMQTTCQKSCEVCNEAMAVGSDGEAVFEEEEEEEEELQKNPKAVAGTSASGGIIQQVVHLLEGVDTLEVFWIGSKIESPMGAISFGETQNLNTYLGHVFSFRDSSGAEMFKFRVMPNRPLVVIDSKAVSLFSGPACVDKRGSSECRGRAERGECATGPGWMVMMCSKSCHACHLRDPEVRCARSSLNMVQTPALIPGALDDQFVAVATSGAYNVTVHSGPRLSYPEVAGNASRDGPWILTFDNFVSDEEADEIISSVDVLFSRSTDQGRTDEFGEQEKIVSQGRTSENAWCTGDCEETKSAKAVMKRISAITGLDVPNYESFQVLRYQPSQYYRTHHDMSASDNKLACGPRIYTFFLYLSDVEEGGETDFPQLRDADGNSLKIKPKKGSALWWPSVLNENPTRQDHRTRHAALPVVKGTKFAANAWGHLFDYSTPNHWGCTGAFD